MKHILFLFVLGCNISCAFTQTTYDKKQDTKLTTATADIAALKKAIAALTATITSQNDIIKKLQDTVISYKGLLSSDYFLKEKNGEIIIPRIPTLETRVAKLEEQQ